MRAIHICFSSDSEQYCHSIFSRKVHRYFQKYAFNKKSDEKSGSRQYLFFVFYKISLHNFHFLQNSGSNFLLTGATI